MKPESNFSCELEKTKIIFYNKILPKTKQKKRQKKERVFNLKT